MSRNKLKKILFLLHLPPPVHGSSMVGKYIHDSQLIQNGIDGHFINLLASKSIDDTGKFTLQKLWAYLGTIIKLKTHLVFKRPELCYFALSTTGAAFLKDAVLVGFLKLFRVPILFHLHNKGVKIYSEKSLYKWLYKFVFKSAGVIILSEQLYEDISAFVKSDQIRLCPNGIPELLNEENFEEINTDVSIQFLFLSNLIEAKGVYVVLDACKILHEKGIDFNCTLVGGEGDINANQLNEKIVQYSLKDKVKYLGRKYGTEKKTIFQQSDVFVFPTFYSNECFPLVLLEAMQFSLPIISTDEGGIPDIVKDGVNGFIAPKRDAQALALKMLIFIESPVLAKRLGKAGNKFYKQHYTLKVFEKRMQQIIQESLAAK